MADDFDDFLDVIFQIDPLQKVAPKKQQEQIQERFPKIDENLAPLPWFDENLAPLPWFDENLAP